MSLVMAKAFISLLSLLGLTLTVKNLLLSRSLKKRTKMLERVAIEKTKEEMEWNYERQNNDYVQRFNFYL